MFAPPRAGGSAVSMRTSGRRQSADAQCSAVWPWSSITRFTPAPPGGAPISPSSRSSAAPGSAPPGACASSTNRPVSTSRMCRSRSSPSVGASALSEKRGPSPALGPASAGAAAAATAAGSARVAAARSEPPAGPSAFRSRTGDGAPAGAPAGGSAGGSAGAPAGASVRARFSARSSSGASLAGSGTPCGVYPCAA